MKNSTLANFGGSLLVGVLLGGLGCQSQQETPNPATQTQRQAQSATLMSVVETPTGQVEAKRLGQSVPASDFEPTGFYLRPNTPLTVEVTQRTGTRLPKLLVGTYSRYKKRWDPVSYQLQAGSNTITDPEGGLIYVRYGTDQAPDATADIRFVKGQVQAPFYVLGKTTQAQWNQMLDTTTVPDVVLLSERAIVVASVANARKYRAEIQDDVLRTADRVIKVEDAVSGLDGAVAAEKPNVHRYLMTETDNPEIYMAATWYRTYYETKVVDAILTTNGARSWGPWHELGHMHQQSKWTWNTLGEVTVNVYSLAVERDLGIKPSRLNRDGIWSQVPTYLALADAQRDFNAGTTSVWLRLAMFQQLWLGYGDTFYPKLHKLTRANTETITTDADKMAFFMKAASISSGHDLSDFFRAWGLKARPADYAAIASLNLPKPTQDLTKLTD